MGSRRCAADLGAFERDFASICGPRVQRLNPMLYPMPFASPARSLPALVWQRQQSVPSDWNMYSPHVGETLDARSLRVMYEQYGPLVYRRALRILGNSHDAEEALHEVFLRVMRGAESFEHRSQITTWLYRITTNYCFNVLRDSQRRRELLEENFAPQDEAHAEAADHAHDWVLLRRLLAEADETQAQAAIYVYVDGMSHDEAAQLLGVSRRTVGNLLERFAETIRERAQPAMGEP